MDFPPRQHIHFSERKGVERTESDLDIFHTESVKEIKDLFAKIMINIYIYIYRSCDFAFPFKGAALFACMLVVEASAADADKQSRKVTE